MSTTIDLLKKLYSDLGGNPDDISTEDAVKCYRSTTDRLLYLIGLKVNVNQSQDIEIASGETFTLKANHLLAYVIIKAGISLDSVIITNETDGVELYNDAAITLQPISLLHFAEADKEIRVDYGSATKIQIKIIVFNTGAFPEL